MPRAAASERATGKLVPAELAGYYKLVHEFPLRHIHNDEQLEKANAMVHALIGRALDEDEEEYLLILADIVEKYEAERFPREKLSDPEALKALLEANNLTQTQLAEETGLSMSLLSEVLHGKRKLNRKQVALLAKHFSIKESFFGLAE